LKSNRTSSPRVPQSPAGYTLLEVLLALGLSGVLMVLVYGAMQSYWQLSTTGRLDAERCQLARKLIRDMESDIRSVTYKAPDLGGGGSEGQAADEGYESSDGSSSAGPAAVEILEDDTYLTANVHLMGDSQSLEMIVLRPTRNRTGSLEAAAFAANESDRRRVGYAFSSGLDGVPGLYSRNVDQQFEQIMEQQGYAVDPASQYQLLAPEVADLRFQYFDGSTSTWVDEWNSRDLGGLPRAIKITIQFHSEAMASTNRLKMSRTSASTEVFQAVVHLPLSDAPLEL
jgi:prepilin-type N-terminal cleavage/methylation domain-containing protein